MGPLRRVLQGRSFPTTNIDLDKGSSDFKQRRASLPHWWRSKDRWDASLINAEPALVALCNYISMLDSHAGTLRRSHHALQRWLADALAWVQAVLASVVRDTWVQGKSAPTRRDFNWSAFRECWAKLDAEPHAAQLAQQITDAHGRGMLSNNICLQIFRYLRPVRPSPKGICLKMGVCCQHLKRTRLGWQRSDHNVVRGDPF